jgi:hypothetical protein
MKTIARLLTRFQGEGDGLFIGALFKAGEGVLKPNTIYEIKDIMGVLTIVEAGRATGAGHENCSGTKCNDNGIQFHWSTSIANVIDHGASIFLTEEEYKNQ